MISTKTIEEKAVNTLKAVLYECPLLSPFISENDKTPSWDGNVFVYNNERQSKSDLIGRVPVQVKGTNNEIRSQATAFNFEIDDLRNFYNDGGAILFLISNVPLLYIPNIYYAGMSVVDLKKILDEHEKQKTCSVQLKRMPVSDRDEITTIFMSFLEDAKKQKSFIGRSIPSLEQLKRNGVDIEYLTINAVGIGTRPFNVGSFISTHEFYIYAKPKGIDVEIPIDKVVNPKAATKIDGTIKVEDREHYSSYVLEYNNGSPTIIIGKGITLDVDENIHSAKMSFKPKGYLDDYIRDTKCYLDIVEHAQVSINGGTLFFDTTGKANLDSIRGSLKYYEDVKCVLDYLGVTEPLNCDMLTEVDEKRIRDAVLSVLYNRKLTVSGTDSNVIYGPYDIANLSIWVWIVKEETGLYQFYNFFEKHDVAVFEDDDDKHTKPIPSSHYLLMDKAAFVHTSNISYDAMSESIRALPHNRLLYDAVNMLMLNALNGYDDQKTKDVRNLDFADELNTWIEESDEEFDENILLLNKLQILKRRRPLTTLEKIEIGQLVDSTDDASIRCGAFLLLDDEKEAQKHYNTLTKEMQEAFLLYPICQFGNLSSDGKT